MATNLITTATQVSGGAEAIAGVGSAYAITFGGTWATGDLFTIRLVNAGTALTTSFGAGIVTGLVPTFLFTFKDKMNFLAGTIWYFSDTGRPTVFNDLNGVGNSFIDLSSTFGFPENLTLILPYQGGVTISSRRQTQIWNVDPDPENYQQRQVLDNVGTFAKLSGRAIGDMDDYMLMDSGIRSIRVRDASNNALLADVGTPIDTIIEALLADMSESEKAQCCAVVDPSSNRYWLYMTGGDIHVFTNYPTSGVVAWSRYRPNLGAINPTSSTYAAGIVSFTGLVVGYVYEWTPGENETSFTSGSTTSDVFVQFTATATTATASGTTGNSYTGQLVRVFAPSKFESYNGAVYARSGDDIFQYMPGSYDNCGVQCDTPYLDGKTPATGKSYQGIDAACEGSWTVALGTDISDEDNVKVIVKNSQSTVSRGLAMAAKMGTTAKFRLTENSTGYARFSRCVLHFSKESNK